MFNKDINIIVSNHLKEKNKLVSLFNRLCEKSGKFNSSLIELWGKRNQLLKTINRAREELDSVLKRIEEVRENIDIELYNHINSEPLYDRVLDHIPRSRFGKPINNFLNFQIVPFEELVDLVPNQEIAFYQHLTVSKCWFLSQVYKNNYPNNIILDIGPGKNLYLLDYKWVFQYPGTLLYLK